MAYDHTGQLIAFIADEDTVVGFILAGIGEINKDRKPNYMVVEKDTTPHEIAETFRSFLKRPDIGIILVGQIYAEMIRPAIDSHKDIVPTIIEIPTKYFPYDPTQDSILRRAKGLFNVDDLR